MSKLVTRILILLLCGVMLLGLVMPALAAEMDDSEVTGNYDERFKRIRTVEDLLAVAEDPDGFYLLEKDLDLTGVEWKPIDFTGVFDGGGHALLNLTLSQPGEETETAYDGNRKPYECSYVGLFGTLRDAEVMNLKLMGVRGVIETDDPCFVGGLAGYCYNSTVTNCTVHGHLELRAHNQMFGIGGILGYGLGAIKGCDADVVLICTDTGKDTLDEQFLGGAYSTGYIDVTDTTIKINGFASEYGYSHNGGIVGLYMQYPLGEGKRGYIMHNTVSGSIKFFEKNNDRRAYCASFAGEVLAVSYNLSQNLQYFKRMEVREYDKELGPCMCEVPKINEYTVDSRCDRYGYTVTECLNCGFMDKHTYTMLQHTVEEWTVVEPATMKVEGLSEGTCTRCGEVQQRKDPVLEPEPTETTEPQPLPEATVPVVDDGAKAAVQGKLNFLFLVLGIATVLLVGLAAYVAYDYRRKN